MQPFDLLIVTARDREQQWLFEQRLRILPLDGIARQVLVVADPPGPQAGSGGSTLYALASALDALGIPLRGGRESEAALLRALEGRRILLVHCGGLSQRLPQFASLGKAFAPVERAEQEATLFQRIVESLVALATPSPGGVLIACGDVLYRAPGAQPVPPGADAVGWAWPARLEQASRHGVYVWEDPTGRVIRTLQKPDPAELRQNGFHNTAPLDTGVLFLAQRVIAALLSACAHPKGGLARRQALLAEQGWRGMDLYRDLTRAFTREGKAEGDAGWFVLAPLARFQLTALCPAEGEFHHFGTTPELQAALTRQAGAGPTLINSVLEGNAARLGPHVVLHNCLLSGPVSVGDGSFAMGLRSEGSSVSLADHRLAYQLPLRGQQGKTTGRRDAVVVLGMEDDPRRADGVSLMGQPVEAWAAARGLSPEDIWPDQTPADRTLWNARVFPVTNRGELQQALDWLQDPIAPGRAGGRERLSLRQIHGAFCARRWWRHESRLRASVLASALARRLEECPDLSLAELAAEVPSGLVPAVLRALERLARRDTRPLHAAQLWRACAELQGARNVASPFHARAFASIRQGFAGPAPPASGRTWKFPAGSAVSARAPVRIDLAGGWTDTPPQACAEGGTVLNAALYLDEQPPIRVRASILQEPVLRFIARDLGRELTCASVDEVRNCQDPTDPFALHKAACLEAGLVSRSTRSLAGALARAGGGLLLETEARVPRGSGLGTSSILGAAVLGCLHHLTGQESDWRALFHAVLRLEQRMTTGGGWQDQIGGLLPGIKLTETAPGWSQVPSVSNVACPAPVLDELHARLVLFYTGVPRLARNVLQRVVDRYLAREPVVTGTLRRMRRLARALAEALPAGDFGRVGDGLSESWELNKALEPSASNEAIETLLRATAPHTLGAKLAGAGGGGFMLFLCRSRTDADRLREQLPRLFPDGRVYAAALAHRGLEIIPGP